jgi:hypothetical protein
MVHVVLALISVPNTQADGAIPKVPQSKTLFLGLKFQGLQAPPLGCAVHWVPDRAGGVLLDLWSL